MYTIFYTFKPLENAFMSVIHDKSLRTIIAHSAYIIHKA